MSEHEDRMKAGGGLRHVARRARTLLQSGQTERALSQRCDVQWMAGGVTW